MSKRQVSTRTQVAGLREAMRAKGATTTEIATAIAARLNVRPAVAYRLALGLTQEQVAERFNQRWPTQPLKSGKQISYWECWGGPGSHSSTSARRPSVDDLHRLASIYGCRVDDLLGSHAAPHDSSHLPGNHPVARVHNGVADVRSMAEKGPVHAHFGGYAEGEDDGDVVTLQVPTAQGVITVRLSRREFTSLMASGGLAALIPGLPAAPAAAGTAKPWPAGEDPADYFSRVLTGHQEGHHLLAPSDHIVLLTRRLSDIDNARDTAGPALWAELRTVQSAYAEHVSWLYKETGDERACVHWADRAAQWGLESGNYPMVSYMLLRKSNLALDARDYTTAIELAQAAWKGPWQVPSVLRGVAITYETRAHASKGGDGFDIGRLDEATELIVTGQNEEGPAYLRFYTAGFAEVQRATCYLDAGRAREAIGILQKRIASLPSWHQRDKAQYEARLAHAHAADRAPDTAANVGLQALTIARDTGSQHTQAELDRLDKILINRWPDQPKVLELHDALSAPGSKPRLL